ncbi:Vacuolar amino acid transporter 5 [Astathelohania contejeani]|uniref:Vacuolar amino acid transporter 5 n=1 Tax=Astathelohania contejeani TaxID=164912 RepID=A0ABQ7I1P1_9MICR|nr:Vacuolar amino acid transporter 5 [Thelohania contejeani]
MDEFISGYVNLLKTVLGSGILSFPGLFAVYGVYNAIILAFISAFLSASGLKIYALCSKKLGRSATLSTLAANSIPSLQRIVELSVFIKCLGVSTTYLIIIKQLLPHVTAKYNINIFFIPIFAQLGIFVILISPLCYFKKIDSLKHTSLCGLLAIFFLLIVSICRLFQNIILNFSTVDIFKAMKIQILDNSFKSPSIEWITNIGKFIFAFTCHQNMFTVHNEMQDNSEQKMSRLIKSVIISALVVYCLFGISNYLLYGDKLSDNILEAYPNDLITSLVYIFYILVMSFSYPLQLSPCRIYALNFLGLSFNRSSSELIARIISTTILIIFTYTIAVSGIKLGTVYSIIGATASTIICFIIPPIFYFNLEIQRTRKYDIVAIFLLSIGVFVLSITLLNSISSKLIELYHITVNKKL